MNSQVEILHKTLEGLAETGGVRYHFSNDNEIEIDPSDKYWTQRIARRLLEEFPKEDSDHVKAYRAIEFLGRYLAEEEIETGYHVDDYVIEEQLRRISSQIEEDALSDIEYRLKEDQTPNGLIEGVDIQLHDPVSKLTHDFSFSEEVMEYGSADSMYDERKRRFKHEILHLPL